jgi:hypothetical protein
MRLVKLRKYKLDIYIQIKGGLATNILAKAARGYLFLGLNGPTIFSPSSSFSLGTPVTTVVPCLNAVVQQDFLLF